MPLRCTHCSVAGCLCFFTVCLGLLGVQLLPLMYSDAKALSRLYLRSRDVQPDTLPTSATAFVFVGVTASAPDTAATTDAIVSDAAMAWTANAAARQASSMTTESIAVSMLAAAPAADAITTAIASDTLSTWDANATARQASSRATTSAAVGMTAAPAVAATTTTIALDTLSTWDVNGAARTSTSTSVTSIIATDSHFTTTVSAAAAAALEEAPTQPTPVERQHVAFRGVKPCSCVSACDAKNFTKWIAYIPEKLEDDSSPWYAYLEALYGSRPSLPFKLSSLRFYYHNSELWSRRHPNVFLPIRPCDRHKRPGREMPNCSARFCKLWKAPKPLPEKDVHAGFGCHPFFGHGHDGDSVGSLCGNEAYHETLPPKTWVEVVRAAFPDEGMMGYGYWFKRATGSAIWLYSGTVANWRKKHEGEYRNMTRSWLTMRHQDANMQGRVLSKYARGLTAKYERFMPGFPLMAWELGYDTVSIQQAHEVVLTTERAMVNPRCARKYSNVEDKIHHCSPGEGGCAGFVTLRTGWNAESPCKCDPKMFISNCDSIIR